MSGTPIRGFSDIVIAVSIAKINVDAINRFGYRSNLEFVPRGRAKCQCQAGESHLVKWWKRALLWSYCIQKVYSNGLDWPYVFEDPFREALTV